MSLSKEQKFWNPIFRYQLLQFSANTSPLEVEKANLHSTTTITVLAWMVRHFAPIVSEAPQEAWTKMMQKVPLKQYVTTSDLAFAVLVLEHHLVRWRKLVQFKLESGGRSMCEDLARTIGGLLYHEGIAGEEAKRRFDSLNVYFFLKFYNEADEESRLNMTRLQHIVDKGVDFDFEALDRKVKDASQVDVFPVDMDDIQKDIRHRIFYYMQ